MQFPTLPVELWREISRLATYTPICFDTSLHPDTWNPEAKEFIDRYEVNFRTKRALTLVSRQIRRISLDFLCDIIIIDSEVYNPAVGVVCKQLGRVSKLIQYLPTTQHFLMGLDGLGHSYLEGAARSLEQILRKCNNLRGLHLSFPSMGIHQFSNSLSLRHDRSLQMQVAGVVCPGLQFLSVQGTIWENVYEKMLDRVSLSLRAHHMSAWTRRDALGSTMIAYPEEIHVPQLESFHWSTVMDTQMSFSKFGMRALTYLVIGIPSPRNLLTHILESARDSILTLRLERRCVVDIDVLSIALSAARLQHLGYPICLTSVAWLNDQLRHDTLREISVV
ncbi:hypothetical protein BD410DRAFT_843619 [Rickenella mellea]|uniref:F-box domain-containing protein n=1 Tax=Rickenella mellea TaxID=50990 RepID=A0A4Y7PSC9_9AGAM|nr:hypothetical protein BD410DRAFT_843619 [Rickenella mellea]